MFEEQPRQHWVSQFCPSSFLLFLLTFFSSLTFFSLQSTIWELFLSTKLFVLFVTEKIFQGLILWLQTYKTLKFCSKYDSNNISLSPSILRKSRKWDTLNLSLYADCRINTKKSEIFKHKNIYIFLLSKTSHVMCQVSWSWLVLLIWYNLVISEIISYYFDLPANKWSYAVLFGITKCSLYLPGKNYSSGARAGAV